MKESKTWTKARLQEMLAWRRDNGKSTRETADHFKVSRGAFAQALTKFGKVYGIDTSLKPVETITKPATVPAKVSKPKRSTPVQELHIPERSTTSKPIAIVLLQPEQFSQFMGALWL